MMKVRKRALRINWIMPRPSMAGGVKSNRLIAEAMVRRGHSVNIAYLAGAAPWPSPLRVRKFLRRLRSKWRVRGKQRNHLEASTANLIPVERDHIRAEDVPDADVSIATFWKTREWMRDWPASKGIHAYFIRHYEVHTHRDTQRVEDTYRMPGLKLVIATWLQRLMASRFGDPDAVLVPNGVDWSQFDSAPREKNRTPTVGMLYGYQEWKGAETAFEAIRIAQRRIPSLRVVAFGQAPLRRNHTPPAHFAFQRRPPQDVIPRIYQQADVWLVPSTSEGFGMPGLEAAASHCPVISTRCGGPEDYVEDGVSGHLVPVGDAEAMAEAIVKVVSQDPASWRRMSEASYQMAQRFDWDRSAEILEDALLKAVEPVGTEGTRRVAGG